MRFNRTSEYALRVFFYLVNQDRELVSVKVLHHELGIPYKYLAALMRRLAGAGFVNAVQGKHGGYRLARPGGEITIKQVLDELEGDDSGSICILGLENCTRREPCALHDRWGAVNSALDEHIYSLSLAELAEK